MFATNEIKKLEEVNKIYINKTKALSDTILKKEYERLLIELSWKSSQIEGNTYSLLDTEALIRENIEAKGHKKEEATMILNHKKALEFIFGSKNYLKLFANLTLHRYFQLNYLQLAHHSSHNKLRI